MQNIVIEAMMIEPTFMFVERLAVVTVHGHDRFVEDTMRLQAQ